MKNGRLKNSITYLLLVLFLSMKIAGLHVLLHSDDKDNVIHCTVCDHAITHNLIPALTPDLNGLTINNIKTISQIEITKNYSFIISGAIASDQLFSRPPPSLL